MQIAPSPYWCSEIVWEQDKGRQPLPPLNDFFSSLSRRLEEHALWFRQNLKVIPEADLIRNPLTAASRQLLSPGYGAGRRWHEAFD